MKLAINTEAARTDGFTGRSAKSKTGHDIAGELARLRPPLGGDEPTPALVVVAVSVRTADRMIGTVRAATGSKCKSSMYIY